MRSDYEDIIYLPHPTSKRHPRMSGEKRAAQFAPFAALTGYDAAVEETARLTQRRRELTEEETALLDEALRELMLNPERRAEAVIEYFVPDERKEGGCYVQTGGSIRRIDTVNGELILEGGVRIRLEDIVKIEAGETQKQPGGN